ncbi:MAG: ABC transporter permease subunit [Verrucomicrobiota bacterium JB022]|nr:ABC transporter permease subunit [Verrucomicrobiota bacterium JB022]
MVEPHATPIVDELPPPSRSFWGDAWSRLARNRLALASLVILIGITLFCVVGPWLRGYGFDAQDYSRIYAPPSAAFPFGTDDLGRDQLVRVMVGGRVSLGIGIVATAITLLIGVTYGAVAGYAGGRIGGLMMRLVDVLYAMPFTIFVIMLLAFFGRNFWLLFVAIAAVEWLTMARMVYGQVRSLKERDFVLAARMLGTPWWEIVRRHLLPNVLGVIVVYATLTVPTVILLESFLSFLGLGVQPPDPSWGSLIKLGAEQMTGSPHLLIIPAAFFSVTLFCLNFLGDGLRDALDPQSRRH